MDRKMSAVESVEEAKRQVQYLKQIDENYLDSEDGSARWSIEYCERYQSLENGLNSLEESGEVSVDPSDVLTAIGYSDYGKAEGLLEKEQEADAPLMDSTVHRRGSPGRGGRF